MYLLTGHRICCVVGHSKYREYAFAPPALHLAAPRKQIQIKCLYNVCVICPVRRYPTAGNNIL